MAKTSYSAQDEMIEFFKNRKDVLNATIDKKENSNDIKNEIVSEWINDVNVRIEASRRFKNNKNKNIKNEEETTQ